MYIGAWVAKLFGPIAKAPSRRATQLGYTLTRRNLSRARSGYGRGAVKPAPGARKIRALDRSDAASKFAAACSGPSSSKYAISPLI
jgi:hypothetical protein